MPSTRSWPTHLELLTYTNQVTTSVGARGSEVIAGREAAAYARISWASVKSATASLSGEPKLANSISFRAPCLDQSSNPPYSSPPQVVLLC